jgi:opacity protein-like surface antigen
MKRFLTACLMLVALATPAFAAATHYAVVDTVGNCAVIDTKPSPYNISGLKIIGDKGGYPSPTAATKALQSGGGLKCKGMIARV